MTQHLRRVALAVALAAVGCGSDPASPRPDDGSIRFGGVAALGGPKRGFRFGAASAATQIEDGNDHTDWWWFTRPTADGGLGKGEFVGEAARGYTKALEDVELIASLGLDSYRFSMEWARIEPARDHIDEDALAHYSAFLDALIARGIRPVVTVHHFSNPVWVDDPRDVACAAGPTDANLCGFGHPTGGPAIVEELAEHARLLGERFGDRVDEWGTLNEPVNYLLASYGIGQFPPGKVGLFDLAEEFVPVVRDYLSGHAAMYAALRAADTADADGDGRAADIGLTLSVAKWEAARFNEPSSDPADVAARDRLNYVFHHLVVESLRAGTFDPDLDGTGDEPQPDWAGTLDWLGVQYYFRSGVTGQDGLVPLLELTPCFATFDFGSCLPATDPTFCVPAMGYEFFAPGLLDVLRDFATRWPDLPLVVSESGIATEVGERRAENVVRTLEQIGRALEERIDVRGYYHWSLYDNFEWSEGYEPRFGLFRVDYSTYERTPTLGATVLAEITAARRVSPELRGRHGGDGPMTPEPVTDEPYTYCSGK